MEKTLHETRMEALASQKEFLNELRNDIDAITFKLGKNKNSINSITQLYNFDLSLFEATIFDLDLENTNIFERSMDGEKLSFEELIILHSADGNDINKQEAYAYISEEFNRGTILLLRYMAHNAIENAANDYNAPDSIREIIKK